MDRIEQQSDYPSFTTSRDLRCGVAAGAEPEHVRMKKPAAALLPGGLKSNSAMMVL
jgi:hypothetical protein